MPSAKAFQSASKDREEKRQVRAFPLDVRSRWSSKTHVAACASRDYNVQGHRECGCMLLGKEDRFSLMVRKLRSTRYHTGCRHAHSARWLYEKGAY